MIQLEGTYESGTKAAQSLQTQETLKGSPEHFANRDLRAAAFKAAVAQPVFPDVPWTTESRKALFDFLQIRRTEIDHARHIKPLVRKDGSLWRVKKCRSDEAFPFAGTTTKVDMPSLQPIAQIKTLHEFAYYGCFKPTSDEVHRCIPAHLSPQLAFFETEGPDTTDDLNREQVALDAGYHVALTTFYAMKTGPSTGAPSRTFKLQLED